MNLTFKALLPLVLAVGLPQFAAAQSVVGRSVVDGRQIEILSNETWRYTQSTTTPADCKEVALGIEFCGDKQQWVPQPAPSPVVAAQFRYDARHYGQYVIEGLGTDDGLTTDFMRKAAIKNASNATGVAEADIAVLDVYKTTVSGREAEAIVYQLPVGGLEVVFVNTIVILPKRTIQAISFAVGATFTEKHGEVDTLFLSLTKVN